MLTKQRMVYIMDRLKRDGFVSVKELQEYFQVSRSSVMRDLDQLEKQGLIQRERGGASMINMTLSALNEPAVISKENINVDSKQLICQAASKLINEGDCIFIDSGTTPVYLLDQLGQKKITLVTPSLYLIQRLPHDFIGEIYLVGGHYQSKYDCNSGSLAILMLDQFHFDHAFISANGMDHDEVYVFDFELGGLKKRVMERSNRSYLLIDSSKINVRAICSFAKPSDFNSIFIEKWNQNIEMPENVVLCKGEK